MDLVDKSAFFIYIPMCFHIIFYSPVKKKSNFESLVWRATLTYKSLMGIKAGTV